MPDYPVPQHPGISGGPPNAAEEAACREAEAAGYRAGVEAVKRAILDIDAHATALGEDEDGFVTGYIISVGCLHRALGIVGHTAPKCRLCDPLQHGCLTAWGALAVAADAHKDAAWRALREAVYAADEAEDALQKQLDDARKVLVFADGCVLANNQQYGDYAFVLADLYAEDCEWAQDALRAAGCHPRGKFLVKDNDGPTDG